MNNTNSFTIKKEGIVDTETTEKDELGIFAALCSSALLVGAGYLIYKGIKN